MLKILPLILIWVASGAMLTVVNVGRHPPLKVNLNCIALLHVAYASGRSCEFVGIAVSFV